MVSGRFPEIRIYEQMIRKKAVLKKTGTVGKTTRGRGKPGKCQASGLVL